MRRFSGLNGLIAIVLFLSTFGQVVCASVCFASSPAAHSCCDEATERPQPASVHACCDQTDLGSLPLSAKLLSILSVVDAPALLLELSPVLYSLEAGEGPRTLPAPVIRLSAAHAKEHAARAPPACR